MLKRFVFENYLIDCCSPTLASLKTASLFNCSFVYDQSFLETVQLWNQNFSAFGLHMKILRMSSGNALVYIYRQSQLSDILKDPQILNFLAAYGYNNENNLPGSDEHLEYCLSHLKDRVPPEKCGFPHEIGVFLGYPLKDVEGYIANKGKNSICVGDWSVYCDRENAVRTFARNKKCKDIYSRLWQSGRRSVLQLTVAG